MLSDLFGNKTIEKILLFLFVNNTCYGAQLARLLQTPLTSLQNGFSRLEKADIVQSTLQGKTKIYQINPSYPLIQELEQLLKKAYTLLPAHDKKIYSLVSQEPLKKRVQEPLLLSFWERLKEVKQFTRESQSRTKEEKGWNGKGKGEVIVQSPTSSILIFHERGSWQVQHGKDISFSNTFRWTLDLNSGMISLEHLRLGADQPVFLFHLTPASSHLLISLDSHLCEEDVYLATVPWDKHTIRLNWRVIGPKKNEEMQYCYY